MEREMAEESAKIRKTREKLKKRIELLEKEITPEALERQVLEIHGWIAKNAMHRCFLEEKEIALFDENKNTAKVSRKISGLVVQIEKELQEGQGVKILQRILDASSCILMEKEK
jgi:ABC-type arginine transport system ATPase subunit